MRVTACKIYTQYLNLSGVRDEFFHPLKIFNNKHVQLRMKVKEMFFNSIIFDKNNPFFCRKNKKKSINDQDKIIDL